MIAISALLLFFGFTMFIAGSIGILSKFEGISYYWENDGIIPFLVWSAIFTASYIYSNVKSRGNPEISKKTLLGLLTALWSIAAIIINPDGYAAVFIGGVIFLIACRILRGRSNSSMFIVMAVSFVISCCAIYGIIERGGKLSEQWSVATGRQG